jgi:heme/copper-type cytochrome/quinol oxidase subunit 3
MKDTGLSFPRPESGPPIPKGRLGVWLLLVAETMFFVGMLGAYVIQRQGAKTWPAPYLRNTGTVDQAGEPVFESYTPPAMETTLPLVNALILTVAFVAALGASRAARRGDVRRAKALLLATALAGLLFLGGVVAEFAHEKTRGLDLHSGNYGSMLFLIIGAHAAHVVVALIWQFAVLLPALARPAGARASLVEYVGVFWGFVAILWWILLGILSV